MKICHLTALEARLCSSFNPFQIRLAKQANGQAKGTSALHTLHSTVTQDSIYLFIYLVDHLHVH